MVGIRESGNLGPRVEGAASQVERKWKSRIEYNSFKMVVAELVSAKVVTELVPTMVVTELVPAMVVTELVSAMVITDTCSRHCCN